MHFLHYQQAAVWFKFHYCHFSSIFVSDQITNYNIRRKTLAGKNLVDICYLSCRQESINDDWVVLYLLVRSGPSGLLAPTWTLISKSSSTSSTVLESGVKAMFFQFSCMCSEWRTLSEVQSLASPFPEHLVSALWHLAQYLVCPLYLTDTFFPSIALYFFLGLTHFSLQIPSLFIKHRSQSHNKINKWLFLIYFK